MNKMTIPNGYRIVETKKRIAIDDAVSILSGRAQTHVTFAKKEGDDAEIVSHRIVCPHCRGMLPAYERFHTLGPTPDKLSPDKLSPDTVDAWGGSQLCLWPDSADTLVFNSVYQPKSTFKCPHCHQVSFPLRGDTEVTIDETCPVTEISCTCTNIVDLLNIPWKTKENARIALPFREHLTFDFESGETSMSVSDCNGNIFASYGINCPDDFKSSKIYQLLQCNTLVRRRLKQSFQRQWHGQLPFLERQLTPDIFLKQAAFIGYPASFFSRIPVEGDRYQVEESFRDIAARIHTADQFRHEIEQSRLPRCKSLRRILYNTPDLGFYLPELELLATWITDVNLLCTLLKRPFIYRVLVFLHTYSSADLGAFFRDYIRLKGAPHLLKRMEEKYEETLLYALQYSGLNTYARQCEQKKWVEVKRISCLPEVPFALPMRSLTFPDTKIGQFDFCPLRSKAEYLEAARQLKNCLIDWTETDNPVVVIRHGHSILGAIEIEDKNRIVQARGKNNRPIPEKCIPAYERWKEKFHLTEGSRTVSDDEDDEDYSPRILTYLKHRMF